MYCNYLDNRIHLFHLLVLSFHFDFYSEWLWLPPSTLYREAPHFTLHTSHFTVGATKETDKKLTFSLARWDCDASELVCTTYCHSPIPQLFCINFTMLLARNIIVSDINWKVLKIYWDFSRFPSKQLHCMHNFCINIYHPDK